MRFQFVRAASSERAFRTSLQSGREHRSRNLRIVELPAETRHWLTCRLSFGRNGLRALQDHAKNGRGTIRLDRRRFRKIGKHIWDTFAVLAVASGTKVLIDCLSRDENLLIGPRSRLGRPRNIFQVSGHRLETAIGQFRCREVNHLVHQTRSRGVLVMTYLQIGSDVIQRPIVKRSCPLVMPGATQPCGA